MRYLVLFFFGLFPGIFQLKPMYVAKDVSIRLFSTAPLEDIEGKSKAGYGIINTTTGEVQFAVRITTFQFDKKLMQEHFNENFMESERYPLAKFKGKLNTVDFPKNGIYNVTVEGELDVHGVKKPRTIKGTITVSDGKIDVSSVFDVKCVDHNIKIPSIVFKNIAETIQLTIKGTFNAATKP